MKITLSKKKILLPSIAVVLLVSLVVGVFYAFTYVKDVLRGVAGEVDGVQGGVMQFELQKAKDLGIVAQ